MFHKMFHGILIGAPRGDGGLRVVMHDTLRNFTIILNVSPAILGTHSRGSLQGDLPLSNPLVLLYSLESLTELYIKLAFLSSGENLRLSYRLLTNRLGIYRPSLTFMLILLDKIRYPCYNGSIYLVFLGVSIA